MSLLLIFKYGAPLPVFPDEKDSSFAFAETVAVKAKFSVLKLGSERRNHGSIKTNAAIAAAIDKTETTAIAARL
jgi:hypothetical protein